MNPPYDKDLIIGDLDAKIDDLDAYMNPPDDKDAKPKTLRAVHKHWQSILTSIFLSVSTSLLSS